MIYDIADMRVEILNRCKYTDKFCAGYLSDDQKLPADISVKVTNEQFYEEKESSSEYSDGYIENICIYRNICNQMPQYDRFLLHAAILDYKGDGYAFLGRSGAGKTTHTSLWLKYLKSTEIINGDKPIIRLKDDVFYGYGTPWMGKEGRGKKGKTPIKGLCFIEKAKENKIIELSEKDKFDRLANQFLFPDDELNAKKTLDLMDKFIKMVPAYVLYCDISEEAVRTSFEKMTGKNFDEEKNI